MAVASCVGSGNIVGVSTAVLVGGLGAIFWMWATALCAWFMILQIIGGNFIQSNTVSGVLKENFGMPQTVSGILLVITIFIVALGGLKRLAHVTQKLVPIMACIYVVGGIFIILANITAVPGVLREIFLGAFGLPAVSGGITGSMIAAMQNGVARGLYSHEAGECSAPVIHSTANVNHPVEQGIVGVTEVFLDTFIICTITGLVLGVTGVLDSGAPGNVLVIYAFANVWEPLRYIVAVSLLLFCISTLMSQWYFGFVGLNYLFRKSAAEKFKYIFPCFCMIGALTEIEFVWTLQDIALGLLTIPNLVAMIVLFPKVRKASKDFFSSQRLL